MRISIFDLKNNEYDPYTLEEIKMFKEEGISVNKYLKKGYTGKTLSEIRQALGMGIDLGEYLSKGFRDSQLFEIRLALQKKLDIKKHIIPEMLDVQIEQIRLGLERGINVSRYASVMFNWMQMSEIRIGLENNVNITYYANYYFGNEQMKEIRLGLEEGLDVSSYARLLYTKSDMVRMHNELKEQADIEHGVEYIKNEVKSETEGLNYINKKPCDVIISKDKLNAYMMINEPSKGNKYSVEDIISTLAESGVVFGINEAIIEDSLTYKEYDSNILVASARKPVAGKDGYYDFLFKGNLCTKPKILCNGSVDYNDIELFETVKEGQLIAEYHKPEKGVEGISVEGNTIPALYGKELPVLRGKGIVTHNNLLYYATVTGSIEKKEYEVNVNKVFIVDRDVRQGTGNISFDGDVVIKGNVFSGMKVEATNNILIYGIVEGANIECGGSLTVKSGVIGNQKAVLKAERNVYCYFVEHADVFAGEDLYADYLLNSNIRASRKITVCGKKGSIIGGNAYAGILLEALSIGNKIGIKTNVILGVDDEFVRKEIQKNKEMRKVLDNIKELEDCKDMIGDDEINNQMARYYSRLSQAINLENERKNVIEEELQMMLQERERMKKPRIFIKRNVYPGVIVKINGNVKKIDEVLNRVNLKSSLD